MLIRDTQKKQPSSVGKRKRIDEVRSDAVFQNLLSVLQSDTFFKDNLNKLNHKPDQMFFKIGDAARIVGVKTYILRYWENEFKRYLRPLKTKSQQRIYRKKDVLYALVIKGLVYEKSFTIEGAKKELGSMMLSAEAEWKETIKGTVLDEVSRRVGLLQELIHNFTVR
jgi:DNA-binding transcriptional MerR regulator